jgi:predicted hotdog family 3-hydroxylacyl-ACP dehydratase
VKSTELVDWIPHRPPMVWIDEVVEISPDSAVCRANVLPQCFSDGKFRPSTYIEWMAQAFAFSEVARGLQSIPKLKNAFLVGITKAEFEEFPITEKSFLVRVKKTRELPPLLLFDGSVEKPTGQVIARASIKVFAEPA